MRPSPVDVPLLLLLLLLISTIDTWLNLQFIHKKDCSVDRTSGNCTAGVVQLNYVDESCLADGAETSRVSEAAMETNGWQPAD